jgi:hypothetical protein
MVYERWNCTFREVRLQSQPEEAKSQLEVNNIQIGKSNLTHNYVNIAAASRDTLGRRISDAACLALKWPTAKKRLIEKDLEEDSTQPCRSNTGFTSCSGHLQVLWEN